MNINTLVSNVYIYVCIHSYIQITKYVLYIYMSLYILIYIGRPEYIGDKLAEKGVVVVSCNYRLGALGKSSIKTIMYIVSVLLCYIIF
jgi:hypothetical protein